jgi:dTDP-glucose 4,6-dehydratase|tara:strand:- start:2495 stop:3520 length:1026 start_codon:yes stop_codon:yes gene_type:complete
MKKNIIVTGGLGFIGSNLIKLLIESGFFVINIDKYSYSSNHFNLKDINKEKYKFFRADINNKLLIKKILTKYKPLGIFNLAAETHVDKSIDDPKGFVESNICGVFNLLEAIRSYLKKSKNKKFKLIHISTDEVYGDISKNKFSQETDAYYPSSPYSASKASSDLLIKSYVRTYGVPAIITNCCNNYGPNQYPEKLIPRIILNIKNNKNLPIYGTGTNEREWIHVRDHCLALVKIFKIGKIGENYNIGTGNIIKNINMVKQILFISKKIIATKSKIIFVKDRPGHDKRYALNSKKIKTKLGWKSVYKFHKGIEDTIQWYLNNEEWLDKLNNKQYSKRIGVKN